MQSFDDFLKNTLTWTQYEGLEDMLKSSPHRVTKIKNNPRIMTSDEIISIASLIGRSASSLIEEFDCGKDEVTAGDMEKLIHEK